MIRRLKFENFCSFGNSGELDLTTSAKTRTDDSFTTSRLGDQVSVLAGVFGPNASGKTNLLKPLAFLSYFLRSSYHSLEPDEAIPIDGFITNSDATKLSLEFEGVNGNTYRYELSLDKAKIHLERLSIRCEKTKSFRTRLLRKAGKRGPLLSQPEKFTKLTTLRNLLKERPNASMLSAGLVTGRSEFSRVFNALGLIETNVDRMGKTDAAEGNRISEIIQMAGYFEENPHFKSELEDHLKRADLGIDGLEIIKKEVVDRETGKAEQLPIPFIIHRSADQTFKMPLTIESAGTKRIFVLLGSFLPVLTSGGTAVIDEMESDLHPHLVPMLLDLFVDPSTNPKRAQLIFTCHHVEILNQLSKEQIYLVSKDKNCVSHVRRLSSIKGILRNENHFANYNAGRYEAVPEPEMF